MLRSRLREVWGKDVGRQPVNKSATMTPECRVVRAVIWGEPVFFTITNARDTIQKHHARGNFYEPEELEIIRRWCPPGSVFCDIGANIGNHAVFALKFLRVKQLIAFEPNPVAIEVLQSNLALNGVLDCCDLRFLGKGLSDHAAVGLSMQAPEKNLGAGKMVADGGQLEVIPGDTALQGGRVDFIKIDVEGMELGVLSGLSETIATSRPTIFIEVDRENYEGFFGWCSVNGYVIKERFKRYPVNENFLVVPKSEVENNA